MCLIICKPAKAKLPSNEVLNNAFDANGDGAGYAYVVPGSKRVTVCKPFWKAAHLIHDIRKVEKQWPNAAMLVHFRWATHGRKAKRNVHPFIVWKTHAMAHNGIIGQLANEQKDSDTRKLACLLSSLGTSALLDDAEKRQALAQWIGAGNKLAFLAPSGKIAIIHEDAGTWTEGCWFSNDSGHKPAFSWDPLDSSYDWTGYGPQTLPSTYRNRDRQMDDKIAEAELALWQAEQDGNVDLQRDLARRIELLEAFASDETEDESIWQGIP